jgi:hypothetical protein
VKGKWELPVAASDARHLENVDQKKCLITLLRELKRPIQFLGRPTSKTLGYILKALLTSSKSPFNQGCQIFLGKYYPKRKKCTK